ALLSRIRWSGSRTQAFALMHRTLESTHRADGLSARATAAQAWSKAKQSDSQQCQGRRLRRVSHGGGTNEHELASINELQAAAEAAAPDGAALPGSARAVERVHAVVPGRGADAGKRYCSLREGSTARNLCAGVQRDGRARENISRKCTVFTESRGGAGHPENPGVSAAIDPTGVHHDGRVGGNSERGGYQENEYRIDGAPGVEGECSEQRGR